LSVWLAVSLSLLLLAANAFFVGAEFALISARRSVIEPRAEAGGRLAAITLRSMENVSLMMAGAQLGITLCTLGLGALAKPAIAHAIEGPLEAIGAPQALVYPVAFIFALLVVASLHVVLGEMVPKNIALARPERSALALAPSLRLVVFVLYPAIASLNWIANALLRLMGVEPRNEVASAFTRDEVAGLVEESRREGFLDSHESRLLAGALDFEERTAKSVLLPVSRLETVPVTVTPAEVEAVAARTGFSRFPVSRDGVLVGYLHLKDALEFKDRHRNRSIAESWVRPLPTVGESDLLRSVLETMQASGAHLAQVAGPDGQTTGVVALEDVLEELIGEVRDATRRKAA
jgi:CBS domain containing-hemolysin-like protein